MRGPRFASCAPVPKVGSHLVALHPRSSRPFHDHPWSVSVVPSKTIARPVGPPVRSPRACRPWPVRSVPLGRTHSATPPTGGQPFCANPQGLPQDFSEIPNGPLLSTGISTGRAPAGRSVAAGSVTRMSRSFALDDALHEYVVAHSTPLDAVQPSSSRRRHASGDVAGMQTGPDQVRAAHAAHPRHRGPVGDRGRHVHRRVRAGHREGPRRPTAGSCAAT